jgi:O-antigen ligase
MVSLSTQNSGIFSRASTLLRLSNDESVRTRRQDYWAGAAKMIVARPWTGWGVGQYPLYQHDFTGQGRSAEDLATLNARIDLAEQAHNLYLQRAAELGLPGLVLLVIVIVTFLFQAVSRVGNMDPSMRRSLLIACIGSTVAFAIDAISNPSWQFAQISLFLWLMLGAGVACLRPRHKQGDKPGDHSEETSTSVARTQRMTASPAVVTASPLTITLLLRRALSVGAVLFLFGTFVLPSASRVAPDVSTASVSL